MATVAATFASGWQYVQSDMLKLGKAWRAVEYRGATGGADPSRWKHASPLQFDRCLKQEQAGPKGKPRAVSRLGAAFHAHCANRLDMSGTLALRLTLPQEYDKSYYLALACGIEGHSFKDFYFADHILFDKPMRRSDLVKDIYDALGRGRDTDSVPHISKQFPNHASHSEPPLLLRRRLRLVLNLCLQFVSLPVRPLL